MTPPVGRFSATVALCLALAVTIASAHLDQVPGGQSHDQLTDVATTIGLTFPAGTEVLGVHTEAGIDRLVRLKLAMNDRQLQSFLKRNDIELSEFRDSARMVLGTDSGWWDPSTAASLPTAQLQRPNSRVLNIGIRTTPGGANFIYLMWFTT